MRQDDRSEGPSGRTARPTPPARKVAALFSSAAFIAVTLASSADGADIALDRTSGPLGSVVTVNAGGFVPGEPVDIFLSDNDGMPLVGEFALSADASGAAAATLVVPTAFSADFSPGPHTIRVIAPSAQSAAAFRVNPIAIHLDTSSAPLSSTVSARVEGFPPESAVEIFLANDGGQPIAFTDVVTDVDGAAMGSLLMPTAFSPTFSPGPHAVRARGAGGLSQAATVFRIASTQMTLDRTSGPLASTVTASLSGFLPLEDVNVHVVDNAGRPAAFADVVTDASGAAQAVLTMPSVFSPAFGPGSHIVRAIAGGGQRQTAAMYRLDADTLQLDHTSGPPGSIVVARLAGFLPGDAVNVQVVGNAGRPVAFADVIADSNGAAEASLSLPSALSPEFSPGPHPIRAIAGGGPRQLAAVYTVVGITAEPFALADPPLGLEGTTTTLIAGGFSPGEPIDISVPDGGTVMAAAGADGFLRQLVTVPSSDFQTDSHELIFFSAAGLESGVQHEILFLRARIDTAAAEPPVGRAGSTTTLIASGFEPGEAITIACEGEETAASAGADGFVRATVSVPSSEFQTDSHEPIGFELLGLSSGHQREITFLRERLNLAIADPPVGRQRTQTRLIASGFTPGEPVEILGLDPTDPVPAGPDGFLDVAVTIPLAEFQTESHELLRIEVHGTHSGWQREIAFVRTHLDSAIIEPPLGGELSSPTIRAGEFIPGESVAIQNEQTAEEITAVTGPEGIVEAGVTIPEDDDPESHVLVRFTLLGQSSGLQRTVAFLRSRELRNTPPQISFAAPGPTVEATDASGSLIVFSVSAIDAEDNPDPVPVCTSAPTGALFPLGGPHRIDCVATDSFGATGEGGFTFSVVDTIPPVFIFPPDITVVAEDPSGAIVNYDRPGALDSVDPDPTVECLPASGTTFAVGNTPVTCTARDDAGNTASTGFTVTVRPPDGAAYSFEGFFSPVGNRRNDVKAGSTVPLKFRVRDASGAVVTDPEIVSLVFRRCDGTGESSLIQPIRYDPSTQSFIANWRTPDEPNACVVVVLGLPDGQELTTEIRLR